MVLTPKWLRGDTAKLVLTAFCLVIVFAGCQRSEQKVAEARDNVAEANQDLKEASRDARADWQENWAEFKRDMNGSISDNERRIIDLRAEVARIDARYQDKYNAQINDAERKNYELRDRMNEYTDQGDEKWEVFKTEVRREFDDLGTSIANIKIENS